MKTQIIFILFILAVSVCSAQDMSSQPIAAVGSTEQEEGLTAIPVSESEMARLQEKAVTDQLTGFLSEHLVYPQQFEAAELQGNLTVRIQLNKRGRIQRLSIMDNELPPAFAKAALSALKGIKKVSNGACYARASPNYSIRLRD